MALDAKYKIDVNPDAAFTINYDDQFGRLVFAIELGNDTKTIFLNQRPTQAGQLVDAHDLPARERIELAIRRIVEHFLSQGLAVELD